MTLQRTALLVAVTALTVPLTAYAVFENPLTGVTIISILQRAILWLLGIAGFIALIALVVGGVRLVIGGIGNESELSEAKRIITWAIIGLVVIGMAAGILQLVGSILGVPGVAAP